MNTNTPALMDKVSSFLVEQLKLHGLPVTLLVLGLMYFHSENKKMQTELQKCNTEIVTMLREDRKMLYDLVENNTEAMQDLQMTILTTDDQWQKAQRKKERRN